MEAADLCDGLMYSCFLVLPVFGDEAASGACTDIYQQHQHGM